MTLIFERINIGEEMIKQEDVKFFCELCGVEYKLSELGAHTHIVSEGAFRALEELRSAPRRKSDRSKN